MMVKTRVVNYEYGGVLQATYIHTHVLNIVIGINAITNTISANGDVQVCVTVVANTVSFCRARKG